MNRDILRRVLAKAQVENTKINYLRLPLDFDGIVLIRRGSHAREDLLPFIEMYDAIIKQKNYSKNQTITYIIIPEKVKLNFSKNKRGQYSIPTLNSSNKPYNILLTDVTDELTSLTDNNNENYLGLMEEYDEHQEDTIQNPAKRNELYKNSHYNK